MPHVNGQFWTRPILQLFCRQNSGILGCYILLNTLSTDNNIPQAFFDENDKTWMSDPGKKSIRSSTILLLMSRQCHRSVISLRSITIY